MDNNLKQKLKAAIETKPVFWSDERCKYWTFDFEYRGKWVENVEYGEGGTEIKSCLYDCKKIDFNGGENQ